MMDTPTRLYHQLYRIRVFEETVLEKFPTGIFYGTTHTYLGQEANAVGVIGSLDRGDIVFSNHRCHGHFLAYGGSPRALFGELMGRQSGVCGGRGGSQHLHWRNFYSNGVQGGIVPVAAGMALAEKLQGHPAIAAVFLGDGTLGEGVIYEAFNLAALWQVPILFVLEHNKIAQTTPSEFAVAGSVPQRFSAFGIQSTELDTADVNIIRAAAVEITANIRRQSVPQALILHSARFGPHSKGDDTRPADLLDRLRVERDPIAIQAAYLNGSDIGAIQKEVEEEIHTAFNTALNDPPATPAGDTAQANRRTGPG